MSYSTYADFILIDTNINNFENDINNLSLEIIENNLINKNIKSIQSDRNAFILKYEIASTSILVDYIDNYFQYLLNIENIENTIGDNFKNKIFFYYYEDSTVNGSLKLINKDSINLFCDVDISYYINKKYLNYIILYDFLSQYNKNLSKIIQEFNIIDNQTFYDFEFSFDMKYYYHPTFGYTNVNTFNKLGLPDLDFSGDADTSVQKFKINSYNIKFKIGNFVNYYNNNDFVNIDDNTDITITNCEFFYDSEFNKLNGLTTITDETINNNISDFLKENFLAIYNKFIKNNSKEFLSIENLSNTYFHYVGKHLELQLKKNLLNYIILFSIYFYIKFNYQSKLGEISDIITSDFHILFKNISVYLNNIKDIIENTQKKQFKKQKQIDAEEKKIIEDIQKLKDDLNNPQNDDAQITKINEDIEKEKKKLIDLKKENLLDNNQYQIKKARDDKKKLYDINKNIEETDIDIKNINNLKNLQNSYLDKIDVISYFIYFFIIVTFFVFSINVSLNNSINISIPIVLIIISIILYIILNYIIKNSYYTNYNNINNNNSILHSLYYSIFNTKKFESFNIESHQAFPTLSFIQNNPQIQQLFNDYDNDTKDILKRTIANLATTLNHKFYDDSTQRQKLQTEMNTFYKYKLSIIHTNQSNNTYFIDLLNKKLKTINIETSILNTVETDLAIDNNNKYVNIFNNDNWFKYNTIFVNQDNNNNIYSTDIKIFNNSSSDNTYEYIILPHNESKIADTNTDNYTEYILNIPDIFENGIDFDIILVSGGESGQNVSQEDLGGAGGSGGSIKFIENYNLVSGQYTIKVGGGGKIKNNGDNILAHNTQIIKKSDNTIVHDSISARKDTLTVLNQDTNNKYYNNSTPNTANYLNVDNFISASATYYSRGGINNSLLPTLDESDVRNYFTKSGTNYLQASPNTNLNDIKTKNINGFDGYKFPDAHIFGKNNFSFRIYDSSILNLEDNIFAAGGGGGFYKNSDLFSSRNDNHLSSIVNNSDIRYYLCGDEFPGIGGSPFVTKDKALYYTLDLTDQTSLDSKTYGGRGSNGSMGGKARNAINNSGSGGGGGSKSIDGSTVQYGGNGSGGIVIMRYNKQSLDSHITQESNNYKDKIIEKLKKIIVNIAKIKTDSDKQIRTTRFGEINSLKGRYGRKERLIQELDDIIQGYDTEKNEIITDIGNEQGGLIQDMNNLKNDISALDSSIQTYDSEISSLLDQKNRNKLDYEALLSEVNNMNTENRNKEIRKKTLIDEEYKITQDLIKLQKEKEDLEGYKTDFIDCKRDSDYIKLQLSLYEQNLDCQYQKEITDLTQELKANREEAIRDSLRAEATRDRILQSQIQQQNAYNIELNKLKLLIDNTSNNSTRLLTFKLNIDYRKTGIFSSDIDVNGGDLEDAAGTDEIKTILREVQSRDPEKFQKEQEKRRNFIETIKFELTNALEISYAENKNRFNILRIYPGNIQRKQSDSSETPFSTFQLSDYETVPDDINPYDIIPDDKEGFALFNVKEHFYDQYSTMDENNLIRQNRKRSYVQPRNLTIIQIQIMPSQNSRQKTTKEILDKLTSPDCIDNNQSLLRNSSKTNLRYVIAYKIDDGDWININNKAIMEYTSFDLLESNYELINNINSKLTIIINTDLQPDIIDYYDKINPYVEKELNKYRNIDNKVKLYNRIANNTKEINIYDIRYKELLLDLIILISLILSIFLLISKFFNNFILYIILLIIISILVFIYYVNYHKIVNTKPDNNYWNTFKN